MLKIFGKTIYKQIEHIFCEYLNTALFLLEWKKGNIVPVYKKCDKLCLKDYRPASL